MTITISNKVTELKDTFIYNGVKCISFQVGDHTIVRPLSCLDDIGGGIGASIKIKSTTIIKKQNT